MRHYLYLTTNKLNNKIYIGAHSSEKPFGEDGYLGSGKYLINSIKKNGKHNFKSVLLMECNTKEELLNWEKKLVNHDFCYREDTYNLTIGGGNPPVFKGADHSSAKPKAHYRRNSTTRANFLVICNRQGWNKKDFSEVPTGERTKCHHQLYNYMVKAA